jgi:hypothetical protein
MKDPIKRALGTSQDLLPSYIDEGVFRYNHGTGNTLVKAFWNEIRAEFTFGGEIRRECCENRRINLAGL